MLYVLGGPGCKLSQASTTPTPSPEAWTCYTEGRKLLRTGREAEAKQLLLKAISLSSYFVEAHRLYQEASIRLCEIRPLIQHYEDLLRAEPKNPTWLYLNGRLRTDVREQQELFSKALALDPSFPWGYFGVAHVALRNQDSARALKLYRKAQALWRSENPIGFVALAAVYLRQGENAEASRSLERAIALDPDNGTAWLLMAKAQARMHQHVEALKSASNAVRAEPENGEAHKFYRLLLKRHGTPSDFQAAMELCGWLVKSHEKSPELWLTLALMQHRSGALASSVESYQKARTLGASPADYANDLRLLYVRLRQYTKALEVFLEKATSEIVFSPLNVAAPRFRQLVTATQEAEKSLGNASTQLHLATAYESAGWLEEALIQYEHVRLLSPQPEDLQARRYRIERHLEFCKRIRAMFEENYFRAASGKPTMGMSEAVRRLYRLAAEVLPAPIQGDTKIRDYAFLGKVTDYRYPPSSGLQKYFWRFNQFFAVGKPWGEPVQCVVLNIISWEPGRKAMLWERPLIHERLIAENAGIRGSDEVLREVRIGGQTVDRFYYVDIDQVWEGVMAHVEMNRRLGVHLQEAQSEPPLSSDPLKIHYLSCVPEILRWQGMERQMAKNEDELLNKLFREVVAGIDAHELGHVLDAVSYVPVSQHLFEDLWLLIRHRFSPRALMAMTERNAQITALAHVAEPRFLLANTIAHVARDVEMTEHAQGYAQLVEDMIRYLSKHPQEFGMDATLRLLDQFPQLTTEQIRRLAHELAQLEGLPQRAAKVLQNQRP